MNRLHILQLAQQISETQARDIEELLGKLEGVIRVSVDADAEIIEVEYDDTIVTKFQMADVLKAHGYAARV